MIIEYSTVTIFLWTEAVGLTLAVVQSIPLMSCPKMAMRMGLHISLQREEGGDL